MLWMRQKSPATSKRSHSPSVPKHTTCHFIFILTDWNSRHDEGIAVEERRRLGAHVAAEVLQQQLLLLGEARGLDLLLLAGTHFRLDFRRESSEE